MFNKSKFLLAAGLLLAGVTTNAVAGPIEGTPQFLTEFNYATGEDICVEIGEGDGLQLDENGIWGTEFGCKFTGFDADKDIETDENTNTFVARANCGDDSGINRPDLITMIFDPQQQRVTVQSQNEYVIEEAVRMSGFINGSKTENPELLDSYVSREYALCETN